METKTINQALLEAQKKIETITKDATANAGSFKYNYATLGQVMEMIKKPLNDAGIIITQPIIGDKVVTRLIYSLDGSEIKDEGTPIICARLNDPQAQGSAISYARRYGLMSLLCLSAEDDDGVKAMPQKTSPSPLKQTINDGVVREPIDMSQSVSSPDNEFRNSTCKDCGGRIAISKMGKPYCTNRCWLPENKHFITEFKNKQ